MTQETDQKPVNKKGDNKMEQPSLVKQLEQAENYLIKAGEILNEVTHHIKTENKQPQPTHEISNIIWTPKDGPKGHYEKAETQDSTEFYDLQKQIDEHNGKLSDQDFFYWVFQDGSIGRKNRKW